MLGRERSGWPGSSDNMPGGWNLSIVERIKFWLQVWGGSGEGICGRCTRAEMSRSCGRDSKEMSWWGKGPKDRSCGLKGTESCSGAQGTCELQWKFYFSSSPECNSEQTEEADGKANMAQ